MRNMGDTYLDDLQDTPNAYIRWGMVEDVTNADISYPNTDTQGNKTPDIVLTNARSVSIKWLDGPGGRDSVKCIEPMGITSMPVKGTLVAVGFTGRYNEPVILGSYTQGYESRIGNELGDLHPGQEVWRKSGLRFRILPHYNDFREYTTQLSTSPWTIDLIMGEQQDQACFCPTCQTRYPATSNFEDGKTVFSCEPKTCTVCEQNKKPSNLILVKGSVATGEGLAWANTQASLLMNAILKGIYDIIDTKVIGVYIQDTSTQQDIKGFVKRYLYIDLQQKYDPYIKDYFINSLTDLWKDLLRTYVKTGDVQTFGKSDVPGVIGTSLVPVLRGYIDGWVQTQLKHYLMGKENLTDTQVTNIVNTLNSNLTSYFTDFLPSYLQQSAYQFLANKSNTYINETLANLRKGAVNWVYKWATEELGKGLKKQVKGWLGNWLPGLQKNLIDVASAPTKAIEAIAHNDFVSAIDKAIDKMKDPEELPIVELRLDQDLASVVNTQLGREEGGGTKTPRSRVRFYRDGTIKVQVQNTTFISIDADGTVDMKCEDLKIEATTAEVSLEKRSNVYINDVLRMGHPEDEYKKITLDKDNVRENTDGLTTREFIETVAWKHVSTKIAEVVAKSITDFAGGGLIFGPNLVTSGGDTPAPPDNSVIGKTESSSKRITGN